MKVSKAKNKMSVFTLTAIKNKMQKYSVTEYAKLIGRTRQCVLYQIKNRRLPRGVIVEKIGKTYVIYIINKKPRN